jgi:NADH-quinone oxidoreductase subunit C
MALTVSITQLEDTLRKVFADHSPDIRIALGEITMTVAAQDYVEIAQTLRDHADLAFEQLLDLCGVDYSDYKNRAPSAFTDLPRYAVTSHLLSLTHNWRLRLRVFATDDDIPILPSLTELWNCANWYEREAFELFGILFEGHLDLRRILTDYGFIGHPFRKDFPTSGHVEMRYDAEQKRVIYQPVTIEPREITPRIVREDNYGGLH